MTLQHPMLPPRKPIQGLYYPTPVTPEDAFQAIERLRKEAADEIDRLLAFLDSTEQDPDLEPSLGFLEPAFSVDRLGETHATWITASVDQSISQGGTADLEDDHDGREPGEDDERTMGWTNREAATGQYGLQGGRVGR